jgi:DNA-binding NarL/FixJ family response regulator
VNRAGADPAGNDSHRTIRVLVAYEDAIRREELRVAMEQAGLSVVGEAAEESRAVYLAKRCLPDVILLDITLPPAGGVPAMRALAPAAPGARVVLLGRSGENDVGLQALMEGAAGYLPGVMDLAALARAVERVVAGEAAISRAMSARLIERLRELSRGHAGMRPVRSTLTTREWDILDLLTTGASTAEIAQQLVLTRDTVRSHVNHILRKLGVHSRQEAVEVAQQLRKPPGYR